MKNKKIIILLLSLIGFACICCACSLLTLHFYRREISNFILNDVFQDYSGDRYCLKPGVNCFGG